MANIKEIREDTRNYAMAELGEIKEINLERMLFPQTEVSDADTLDDFEDVPVLFFKVQLERDCSEWWVTSGGTMKNVYRDKMDVEELKDKHIDVISDI